MIDEAATIWGIHAGSRGEAEALFAKGYVALGWDRVDDLSRLPPARESFKQKVGEAYPQDKPGSIPVSAGKLYRFAVEMRPGDLVVWRSKLERVIRIGQVAGPYRFDPGLDARFPHVRPTTWLKKVEPGQVTQGARYEIGSAMTLFQVRTYADEWRQLVTGNETVPRPSGRVEDPTVAIVSADIEELTRDFILSALAQELKGHPFAAFVAHVLGTMGYRARLSPEGPDGGIDIVAHRDELGFEPPLVKVQVKSGSGNVGQPEVSSLLGTLAPNEFGLMVTLGGFTSQARNFARSRANLRLVDGAELVDLVLAHYEQLDSRYRGLLPLKRVYVPEPIEAGDG